MRFSFMGTLLNVAILVFTLFIGPMYDIGLINWQLATNQTLYETRHLVDTVIDTRTLEKTTLADYNLALASISEYMHSEIIHEVKVIDPDPSVGVGATRSTYVVTEDIQNYKQGDLITVKVTSIAPNSLQSVVQSLLGLRPTMSNFTICGKVR